MSDWPGNNFLNYTADNRKPQMRSMQHWPIAKLGHQSWQQGRTGYVATGSKTLETKGLITPWMETLSSADWIGIAWSLDSLHHVSAVRGGGGGASYLGSVAGSDLHKHTPHTHKYILHTPLSHMYILTGTHTHTHTHKHKYTLTHTREQFSCMFFRIDDFELPHILRLCEPEKNHLGSRRFFHKEGLGC